MRSNFIGITIATILIINLPIPSISALPWAPQTPHRHHQRRGLPGAVYICTMPQFRGICGWVMPSSECHIPGTGTQAPQSIGPDPGGFCVLYEKADCTGNQVKQLQFPGQESNLPEFGGIKCFAYGSGEGGASEGQTGAESGGVSKEGVDGVGDEGEEGDARLAGGYGSQGRKEVKDAVERMMEEGLREGMIGLEKGRYY